MRSQDKVDFKDVVVAAFEMFGRSEPSKTVIGMWWAAFRGYEINEFKLAMSAELQESKFVPTIAGVLEHLKTHDNRLPADEAWSLALQAADESVTVVWTDEIAEAWGAAQPILSDGDKVAARMAFKSAYERIVELNRDNGKQVHWLPTLGTDPHSREQALTAAADRGLLSHQQVAGLLPTPEKPMSDEVKGLLEDNRAPADHKAHLGKLREVLAA